LTNVARSSELETEPRSVGSASLVYAVATLEEARRSLVVEPNEILNIHSFEW
jgi:hypothetical protein